MDSTQLLHMDCTHQQWLYDHLGVWAIVSRAGRGDDGQVQNAAGRAAQTAARSPCAPAPAQPQSAASEVHSVPALRPPFALLSLWQAGSLRRGRKTICSGGSRPTSGSRRSTLFAALCRHARLHATTPSSQRCASSALTAPPMGNVPGDHRGGGPAKLFRRPDPQAVARRRALQVVSPSATSPAATVASRSTVPWRVALLRRCPSLYG